MTLPLIPSVAQDIIWRDLYGKTLKRIDIIKYVVSESSKVGMVIGKQSPDKVVKKALRSLAEVGNATKLKHGTGWWQIGQKDIQSTHETEQKSESNQNIAPICSCLYVYYYETYKKLATLQNHKHWRCKIGKASNSAACRVAEQCGTGTPEKPVVALEWLSHDCDSLEKAVHAVLRARGRWLDDTNGKEWFLTNPQEVEEICKFVELK
jgi:hypothetical protein